MSCWFSSLFGGRESKEEKEDGEEEDEKEDEEEDEEEKHEEKGGTLARSFVFEVTELVVDAEATELVAELVAELVVDDTGIISFLRKKAKYGKKHFTGIESWQCVCVFCVRDLTPLNHTCRDCRLN